MQVLNSRELEKDTLVVDAEQVDPNADYQTSQYGHKLDKRLATILKDEKLMSAIHDELSELSQKDIHISEIELLEMICLLPYKHLANKGGGVKGIAYVGTNKVLEILGLLEAIETTVGASAGALTAAFIALGYTSSETKKVLSNFTEKEIKDGKSRISVLHNLLTKGGIDTGEGVVRWFTHQLTEKNIDPDITLGDMDANPKMKDLMVIVSDLTHGKRMVISAASDPHMRLVDLIRFTTSIPGYFMPMYAELDEQGKLKYSTDAQGKKHLIMSDTRDPQNKNQVTLVDGGLIDNIGNNVKDFNDITNSLMLSCYLLKEDDVSKERLQELEKELKQLYEAECDRNAIHNKEGSSEVNKSIKKQQKNKSPGILKRGLLRLTKALRTAPESKLLQGDSVVFIDPVPGLGTTSWSLAQEKIIQDLAIDNGYRAMVQHLVRRAVGLLLHIKHEQAIEKSTHEQVLHSASKQLKRFLEKEKVESIFYDRKSGTLQVMSTDLKLLKKYAKKYHLIGLAKNIRISTTGQVNYLTLEFNCELAVAQHDKWIEKNKKIKSKRTQKLEVIDKSVQPITFDESPTSKKELHITESAFVPLAIHRFTERQKLKVLNPGCLERTIEEEKLGQVEGASLLMQAIHRDVVVKCESTKVSRDNVIKHCVIGSDSVLKLISQKIKMAHREVFVQMHSCKANSAAMTMLNETLRSVIEQRRRLALRGYSFTPLKLYLLVDEDQSDKLAAIQKCLVQEPGLVEVSVAMFNHNSKGATNARTVVIDNEEWIMTTEDFQDTPCQDTVALNIHGSTVQEARNDFLKTWRHDNTTQLANRRTVIADSNSDSEESSSDEEEQQRVGLPMLFANRDRSRWFGGQQSQDRMMSCPQNSSLFSAVANSKTSIRIATPLLNNKAIVDHLIKFVQRGGNLHILVEKESKELERLITEASKITGHLDVRFSEQPTQLRFMSFDNQVVIMGSATLDDSSLENQHEVNLVIDSVKQCAELTKTLFRPAFLAGKKDVLSGLSIGAKK